MSKNITVILGHPNSVSYCAALAEAYVQSASAAGHQVKFFKLGELQFDPILRHGYQQRQELEPDLLELQSAISWANHLVLVYPTWWGAMPALLKGLFDRVLLPGFAFKYRENSQFWDKLLAGRSAHALVTMDTPPWFYRLFNHMPGHHQLKKTILGFCGFNPIKITTFGSVRQTSAAQREKWLQKTIDFARSI